MEEKSNDRKIHSNEYKKTNQNKDFPEKKKKKKVIIYCLF